jgi:hypothetical protein
MDRVVFPRWSKPHTLAKKRQRIARGPLLERVVRLRDDVDADDVEPGPVVAHGCTAGTTEQIQQPGLYAFIAACRPGG